MAISLVTVGGKITAAITNAIIGQVNAQGMTSVTATTVAGTGVSTGSGGSVVMVAATSATANGVFSGSTPFHLKIRVTTSVAANLTLTLTVAGTPAVTLYDREVISGAGSTAPAAGQNVGVASWPVSTNSIAGGRHIIDIDLFDVAQPIATGGQGVISSTDNPMTAASAMGFVALQHRTATAYDGIQLTCASGTMSGTIWVTRIAS